MRLQCFLGLQCVEGRREFHEFDMFTHLVPSSSMDIILYSKDGIPSCCISESLICSLSDWGNLTSHQKDQIWRGSLAGFLTDSCA